MRKATAVGQAPTQILPSGTLRRSFSLRSLVLRGEMLLFSIYQRRVYALTVLALTILIAPRLSSLARAQATPASIGNYLVYVGTYTSTGSNPAKSTGSKGIYAYRFDSSSGEIEPLGLAAESEQPSFLAVDPTGKYLYAVNETDTYQGQPTGGVSAFSIDRSTGMLTFLNELPSRGGAPAHVAVDHTGKYVLVSNYNGGSLAVFPALPDGRLGDPTAFVQHHGSSVNKSRQAGPHVHEIVLSPDNRFALSTDLGLDDLFVYPFDAKTGVLGAGPRVLSLTPGFGPRHLAFSPDGNFVYLVSEIGSTITVIPYSPKDGAVSVREAVRLAPISDDPAKKAAAEIAVGPSGKYLYASNRFDDFIAVYSIENSTGMITRTEAVVLDGKTPRDFALDPGGQWLWDANQDSDTIILFRIDPHSGGLIPSGLTLKVSAPTCVVFVPIS
jgi:6-phosphogluconolactonase